MLFWSETAEAQNVTVFVGTLVGKSRRRKVKMSPLRWLVLARQYHYPLTVTVVIDVRRAGTQSGTALNTDGGLGH